MPPKGKKIEATQPPKAPPKLVKTAGAFSLQSAPGDLKLSVFKVIKEEGGLDVPQGQNVAVASKIILRLYGKGGVLQEYDEPTNETSWLGRCKTHFTSCYDALQVKTHGDDDEEEVETELEKFLNKTFSKTKMGKQRKKNAETQKDNAIVSRVLGAAKTGGELEEEEEEEEDGDDGDSFGSGDDEEDNVDDDDEERISEGDRKKVLASAGMNSKTAEKKKKKEKRRGMKDADEEEDELSSCSDVDSEKSDRSGHWSSASDGDGMTFKKGPKRKEGKSKGRKRGGGGGQRRKRQRQRSSDGLSLPGGDASSKKMLKILEKIVDTSSSSSSSSAAAAAAVPPTPTASGEDNEMKLARYRAEQVALLADIRAESDDVIKSALKEQFATLAKRISDLAALCAV